MKSCSVSVARTRLRLETLFDERVQYLDPVGTLGPADGGAHDDIVAKPFEFDRVNVHGVDNLDLAHSVSSFISCSRRIMLDPAGTNVRSSELQGRSQLRGARR